MAEKESVEYLTVLKCMGKLELTFKGDRDLARFLLQEGFISNDTYDDVLNSRSNLTEVQRAGKLLGGLMVSIKMNHQKYHKFVDCLRGNPRIYADIVYILDKEFCRGKDAETSKIGK